MEINPSEVTKILKEQIKNFGDKTEVTEVGQVLSVGDGIARIYGLENVLSLLSIQKKMKKSYLKNILTMVLLIEKIFG